MPDENPPSRFARRRSLMLKECFPLALVVVIAVWSAAESHSYNAGIGTGRMFMELAYHLADGDGFVVESRSGNALRPTNAREPAYPFFLAAGFLLSGVDTDRLSTTCLDEAAAACRETLLLARRLNLIPMISTIVLAFFAVRLFCGTRPGLAAAAVVAVVWQGAAVEYTERFMSENLILPVLLLHAVFLAYAFKYPSRHSWAVLSGIALAACVLTKAIFILYVAAGGIAIFLLWFFRAVRRRPEYRQIVVVMLIGGIAWGGWSLRNDILLDDARFSARGESILGWRAQLGLAGWPEIAEKALYYTPYYGRDLVNRFLDAEAIERLQLDDSGGMRRRSQLGIHGVHDRIDAFDGPRDKAETWVPIIMIVENWPKHLVLTPILIWRGFGMPTGQSWTHHGNTDRIIEIGSQALTVLLVPALFVAAILAWRRRSWPLLAFLVPFLFVVVAHATLTHYRERFGVPVIPGGIVALCWLAMVWMDRRTGRAVTPG